MKMILMLGTAAALATAAGAQPLVVDGDARSTVRVAYDDLNLDSARGRERLTHRVTSAVRAMCRDDNPDSLKVELAEQQCYTAAMQEADRQIGAALKQRSISFAEGSRSIQIARR